MAWTRRPRCECWSRSESPKTRSASVGGQEKMGISVQVETAWICPSSALLFIQGSTDRMLPTLLVREYLFSLLIQRLMSSGHTLTVPLRNHILAAVWVSLSQSSWRIKWAIPIRYQLVSTVLGQQTVVTRHCGTRAYHQLGSGWGQHIGRSQLENDPWVPEVTAVTPGFSRGAGESTVRYSERLVWKINTDSPVKCPGYGS